MIKIQPQYVVDEKQQRKAVLISLTEWERILDNLEELEDILRIGTYRVIYEGCSGIKAQFPLV
jgi:PHD/YefM family antitoxin component YafN of YafNO toxin-antitoxin module